MLKSSFNQIYSSVSVGCCVVVDKIINCDNPQLDNRGMPCTRTRLYSLMRVMMLIEVAQQHAQ